MGIFRSTCTSYVKSGSIGSHRKVAGTLAGYELINDRIVVVIVKPQNIVLKGNLL